MKLHEDKNNNEREQMQTQIDQLTNALSTSQHQFQEMEQEYRQERDELLRKILDIQDQVKLEQGKIQLLEQIADEKKLQMQQLVNGRNQEEKQLRIVLRQMQLKEKSWQQNEKELNEKLELYKTITDDIEQEVLEVKKQMQDAREMIQMCKEKLVEIERGLEESIQRESELGEKTKEQNDLIQRLKLEQHSYKMEIEKLKQELQHTNDNLQSGKGQQELHNYYDQDKRQHWSNKVRINLNACRSQGQDLKQFKADRIINIQTNQQTKLTRRYSF